jgi:hypothetical protein
MDIANALRRTGRDDITTRAIIANVIRELYPHEIHIESVKISGKKIIIRTGNSIANSELNLLSGDIKKVSLQKLWDMGIRLSDEIIFRFV